MRIHPTLIGRGKGLLKLLAPLQSVRVAPSHSWTGKGSVLFGFDPNRMVFFLQMAKGSRALFRLCWNLWYVAIFCLTRPMYTNFATKLRPGLQLRSCHHLHRDVPMSPAIRPPGSQQMLCWWLEVSQHFRADLGLQRSRHQSLDDPK